MYTFKGQPATANSHSSVSPEGSSKRRNSPAFKYNRKDKSRSRWCSNSEQTIH